MMHQKKPREKRVVPCDTCGEALRRERGIWSRATYYVCDHGCFACAFCAGNFRKGEFCDECRAASSRQNGPQFCRCGAPMIAKGLPVVFLCKAGCAICPACHSPVAFGDQCEFCNPRPLPVVPEPEFDDDLPF